MPQPDLGRGRQGWGMFEGFETRRLDVGDAAIHFRLGGDGPPLPMLHGYPQTHAMWRKVAPALAERFTLVLPDLRSDGDSAGPTPDASGAAYAKREMAKDMARVMAHLGFERFRLAGHDRGGRVAYRLAFDFPGNVERLAALDIIPTLDVWVAFEWKEAIETYRWPFLAQPGGTPERPIGADPDFYLEHLLDRWAKDRDALDEEGVEALSGRVPTTLGGRRDRAGLARLLRLIARFPAISARLEESSGWRPRR